jgi:UrcA family protein
VPLGHTGIIGIRRELAAAQRVTTSACPSQGALLECELTKVSHYGRAQPEKIMANAHHLLGAAVAALSLTCAAAYAESPPVTGSPLVVRFNDLNLDQPRDVARLLNRVSAAADKVCGTRSFAGHYNKIADYEICYKDTVASTIAHIDRPLVTAYFEQHSTDLAPPKLIAQQ